MTDAAAPTQERRRLTLFLDGMASVFFAAFVALLLLGYLGMLPTVPFDALAAVALVGSLGCLLWANLMADRRGR